MISEHLSTLFIPPVECCVVCQNSTQKSHIATSEYCITKSWRELHIIYVFLLYLCPGLSATLTLYRWTAKERWRGWDKRKTSQTKMFQIEHAFKDKFPTFSCNTTKLMTHGCFISWILFYLLICLLDVFYRWDFLTLLMNIVLLAFNYLEKQVQDWQEPKKGCNLIPRTSSQTPNTFLAYVFELSTFIIMTTCLLWYSIEGSVLQEIPCPATKMFVWIPVATSVQRQVSLICSWQADYILHGYRIHP